MVGIRNTQAAAYTVQFEDGEIQIRAYAPMIIAETTIDADYANSGSIGFQRLAGYIFGNNRSQQKMAMTTPVFREASHEKIAMTAPVLQEANGEQWLMSFVMPAGYKLEDLPEPIDPLVQIKPVAGKKVAVLSYSGSLSEARIAKKAEQLTRWLEENHYQILSPARSAAYDPPWTIPALRHNEVHIDVE